MEKAVVLLSGGLNSAVAAATLARTQELCTVFAHFHQRALQQELKAYEKLCEHLGVLHHWRAELSHFKQVGGNALVDPRREIEDAAAAGCEAPGSFVAALMPALLDVAVSFAVRIGAASVVTGISEAVHESGLTGAAAYPDNRREFVHNYQYMIDSALPKRSRVKIEAPLIDATREEIVRLGARFKVPFEATWSCYDGGEAPCGRCLGCAVRTRGFNRAGMPDPLSVSEAGAGHR